jgi:group I intron endonuclease
MSTSGIYALNFNGGTNIYIGQSQDIDARTSRHIRDMQKQNHYNYRVQGAYNQFGLPEIVVLEVCDCDQESINRKENFWIDEFDSCRNGLNLRDKDESALRGVNSNSSKYTRQQILDTFELLLDINNTSKHIENITGVPSGNINCIARSASHLWLKEEFPDKYILMESLKGKRNGLQNTLASRGKVWPTLVSPNNTLYSNIPNLKKFCSEHMLPYDQIHRVCSGKSSSAHGWKVQK